jgi:hypothetical protein
MLPPTVPLIYAGRHPRPELPHGVFAGNRGIPIERDTRQEKVEVM